MNKWEDNKNNSKYNKILIDKSFKGSYKRIVKFMKIKKDKLPKIKPKYKSSKLILSTWISFKTLINLKFRVKVSSLMKVMIWCMLECWKTIQIQALWLGHNGSWSSLILVPDRNSLTKVLNHQVSVNSYLKR